MCNYEKLLAPFCKKFWLREQIQLFEGLLANMLVIITLATLLQISPKFVEFCNQKVFSFINSSSFKLLKIFQNPLI